MIARLLVIAVLGSSSMVYGQGHESDSAFVSALWTVVDSAQHDFADLKGELLMSFPPPVGDQWSVSLSLPGFKQCFLVHELASVVQRDHFWYDCNGDSTSAADRQENYQLLLALVEWATDWPFVDMTQTTRIFNGPGGESIVVGIYFDNLLSVGVYPTGRFLHTVPAASGGSQVEEQIRLLESRSDTSPLPKPLVSDRATSTMTVSRTLDNRTAQVLTVLMTGPIDKRVVLPPGTKHTFEIPQGNYKVAAQLLSATSPP